MNKITGTEFPLKDIFNKSFDFSIPAYQRPYSWMEEQTNQLLDDLLDFMENQNSNDTYFLGSIVLIKEEAKPKAEVIDGQQRLTTITILLAVIASMLNGQRSTDFWRYINEPGNEAEDLKPKPRLTIRSRDNDFFKRYVQDNDFERLLKLEESGLNDVEIRIKNNSSCIISRLKREFEDNLEGLFEFGKFVIKRCYLVAVSTNSENSAYRIFSVLNSRGLDLLSSDLIKADVIGGMEEYKRNDYNAKWEDIEESLGRDNFDKLFGYIRMALLKVKIRSSIRAEFKDKVFVIYPNKTTFFTEVLEPYADAYQKLLNNNFQEIETKTAIKWLLKIDNSDWIPVALRYLVQYPDNEEHNKQFFTQLERIATLLFITRANVNQRIDRYSKIIKDLDSLKFERISFSDYIPRSEIKNVVGILKSDIYNIHNGVKKHILLKLDELLSEGEADYNFKILSIEHVLPRNFGNTTQWSRDWNDKQKESWLNKLGNLVLLSRRKNSQAANHEFEKKKTTYFASTNGVTNFALTTTVVNEEKWTPEVVQKRQEMLLRKLKDYYKLHQN